MSEKFFMQKAMKSDGYEWDIPDKFAVINHLRTHKLYGLEGDDCALRFSKDTGRLISDPFFDIRKVRTHIPDVVIWNHKLSPILFEIDGDAHKDGTTPETIERNTDYLKNRLRFVVIDKKRLKLEKMSWQEYIDKELVRLGIIQVLNNSVEQ